MALNTPPPVSRLHVLVSAMCLWGPSLRAVTAGPPEQFSVCYPLSKDPAFSGTSLPSVLRVHAQTAAGVVISASRRRLGKNQQTSDLLANSLSSAKLAMAHTDGHWGLQGPLTAILKDLGEAAPSLLKPFRGWKTSSTF